MDATACGHADILLKFALVAGVWAMTWNRNGGRASSRDRLDVAFAHFEPYDARMPWRASVPGTIRESSAS